MVRFNGIVVPPFTIFNPDLSVNVAAQELLTKHVIRNGADVLFLCGSTGEGQFLQLERPDQRYAVVAATVRAMDSLGRRLPVIIGIYGEDPGEVLAQHEAIQVYHAGYIDGIVLSPPLKRKLDDEGLASHFMRILDGINFPVFFYNNPATFGGNVIPVSLYTRCIDSNPSIVGIKDSSKDMDYKKTIFELLSTRQNTCYYEGGEGAFFTCLDAAPATLAGRIGCVPSISNVLNLPPRIKAAFESGDRDAASHLQGILNGIRNRIYHEPSTKGKAQRGGKQALALLYPGTALDAPVVVHPGFQREMTSDAKAGIKAAVDEAIEQGHVDVGKDE